MRVFYRLLGAVGLLTRWNQTVCRLGRYHQYQPGVCGWCGRPHVSRQRYERQVRRMATRGR